MVFLILSIIFLVTASSVKCLDCEEESLTWTKPMIGKICKNQLILNENFDIIINSSIWKHNKREDV